MVHRPINKKISFSNKIDINGITLNNEDLKKHKRHSSMSYPDGTRTLGRMGPPPHQGQGRFGGGGHGGPGLAPGLGQRGFSDPGMPPFAMGPGGPGGPGGQGGPGGPGGPMGGPMMGGPGGPMMGGPGGPRPFMSSTLPRNGIGGQRRAGPADPFMEMERMKRAMVGLQEQLTLADNTIIKLRSGQDIQNGVAMGGKFENISQGGTRPSQIIEQYGQLYSQGRLNAMDDLDQIAGLSKYGKHTEMKQKILYGIMVASYKVSYEYLTKLKNNIKRLMDIPEKHSPNEKDVHGEALTFLTSYFQSTTQNFALDPIVQDVQDQLIQLLPEFPSLSRLPGISQYSADCCRVAWHMVNQIQPLELEHSQEKFNDATHTRFHASSEKTNKIKMYVWPTLIDTGSKAVLFKGVVWT
ncbi:uncharacterized protein [Clytia hemisphaerica]|uniref:Mitochondria-eating protein n=2 Tax=Clytia hemisphaerica TaxID=252671 RepID=A0A7M5UT67_9CNID